MFLNLPPADKLDTMANEDRLTVFCPECRTEIVVDVGTGQVLRHEAPRGKIAGGKNLEDLMADLDESKKRASEVFDREVTSFEERDRLLEAKFEEALKKSKESDNDDLPLKPWELD